MRIKKKILKEIDKCVIKKKRLEEKDMDNSLLLLDPYEVSSENEHELIRSCLSTIDAKKAWDIIDQERGECQELLIELFNPSKELLELIQSHNDESTPDFSFGPEKLNDDEISNISKEQRKIGLLELQLKKKGPHLYQYYKYRKTKLGKLLMKSYKEQIKL